MKQAARANEAGLSAGTHSPCERQDGGGQQEAPANGLPTTEDSLGLKFADRNRGRLKFDHDVRSWYVYNGTIWRKDATGGVFHQCRTLARAAAGAEDIPTKKALGRMITVGGIERAARTDPSLAVTSRAWNPDPFLAGAPSCTIDLRKGRKIKSSPDLRITKSLAVDPSDEPTCPRFRQFLNETFSGDSTVIRFVQQFLGYSMTGIISEHALVYGIGGGGNGKSVLLNLVGHILGDYAVAAPMEMLVASKWDRHPTELAMLQGARFVTASETESGRAWAEARVKQLTGGDPIRGRFMRQDFFEFLPTFKLFVVGNHTPRLKTVDDAIRRRINLLPFNNKPEHPDRDLEAKLRQEAPGILRWILEGCLDWQANGLVRPDAVARATETYFADQDLFGQWLDEACDAEPGNHRKAETAANLFENWGRYAGDAGEDPGHKNDFGERLARAGFQAHRRNGGRFWRGIRLKLPTTGNHSSDPDNSR